MSHHDDHDFYARRTAEEMERGDQAVDAAIAAVHYELAYRYSILAAETGRGRPKLTLVDGDRENLAA